MKSGVEVGPNAPMLAMAMLWSLVIKPAELLVRPDTARLFEFVVLP